LSLAGELDIDIKYATANDLLRSGVEIRTGTPISRDPWASRRFVRDTMFPGSAIRDVQVPAGKNVDEFLSVMHGGPQVRWNQWLMDAEANQLVGPIEARAASEYPPGTRIRSFDLIWEP
jgi:hypothetical protein